MKELQFSQAELEFINNNSELIEKAFDSTDNYIKLTNTLFRTEGLTETERDRLAVLAAYCTNKSFILDNRPGSPLVYLSLEGLWAQYLINFSKEDENLEEILNLMDIPDEIIKGIAMRSITKDGSKVRY